MIQRLLMNIDKSALSEKERLLQFYKSNVELEQMKEPDISKYYPYPVNLKEDDNSTILIDLPCNKEYLNLFEENRDRQRVIWPKNLYMGLCMTLRGEAYHVLCFHVPFDQIKGIKIDEELLPCRITSLSVNPKVAAKLLLTEEDVNQIEADIRSNPTIEGITEVLRSRIDPEVELDNCIYLALSQKNPSLSQIYAELDRLKESELSSHVLLSDFLLQNKFGNRVDEEDPETILQISDLDASQKEAVANALNSKVSVITGPPGCGKTQVILNILVNALLKGKKVLVASKNNKAVDNVKDRFDLVDPTGYFLRFGHKLQLQSVTLPAIETCLSTMRDLPDNYREFNDKKGLYTNLKKERKNALEELSRKTNLEEMVASGHNLLLRKESDLIRLQEQHTRNLSDVQARYADVNRFFDISQTLIDQTLSELKNLSNEVSRKKSGLFGFLFNLLYRKKLVVKMLGSVEGLPLELKQEVRNYRDKINVESFRSSKDLEEYSSEFITFLTRLHLLKYEYEQTHNRNERERRQEESKLNEFQQRHRANKETLRILTEKEPSLLQRVREIEETIKIMGSELLRHAIVNNKRTPGSISHVQAFRSYLKDGIPWKESELCSFVTAAKKFLEIFKLNSVTSLSVKSSFPLEKELFDMVIIDEASQCDIASALPLIYRTKQLVVIGDPMQLRHITANKPIEEKLIKEHLSLADKSYLRYTDWSLWDYCSDFLSKAEDLNRTIMLNCHYRCHPDIIGYSNDMFYSKRLGCNLNIMTSNDNELNPKGIYWFEVRGVQKSEDVNINEIEAQKSVEIALWLASKYQDQSIGIVTPFRHQAERISSLIPAAYSGIIIADTVHKYQGDEKDIMIYSLVVTANSPDTKIRWIDYGVPNLVNVAVSRAKKLLVVIGNSEYIERMSNERKPLGYLVRYAKKHTVKS